MSAPATKDDIKILRDEIRANSERLIELVQASFARIDQRFDESAARSSHADARLTRHAGLLQTGSRWTGRMNEWAEKIDTALAKKDEQIANLSERVRKLEEGRQ